MLRHKQLSFVEGAKSTCRRGFRAFQDVGVHSLVAKIWG